MNKAFVREPDPGGSHHCPQCGSLAIEVETETLHAHLRPEQWPALASHAFFCPYAKCPVAYFDLYERVVLADDLSKGVYPKDPAAPLCGCFGFTTDDLEADLAETVPRRIRALLARANSAEAHCQTAAPSGQCCIAQIQRIYLQRRSERQG